MAPGDVDSMGEAATGGSVWAIGDIHGKYAMLASLLDAIPRKPADTTVFLGDYIDRGEDSAACVRRVLQEHESAPERTVLLWGNHEDLAASNWDIKRPSKLKYDSYDWFRNGGTQALESYGVKSHEIMKAQCPEDLAKLFKLLQTFWRAPTETYPALENVIWVHAGVLPGHEPEELDGDTLLWVRDEFLETPDTSGRIVVHGHTPFREIRLRPGKIGIDTGAVFGGKLTALQLPERIAYQVDAAGNVTKSELSPV